MLLKLLKRSLVRFLFRLYRAEDSSKAKETAEESVEKPSEPQIEPSIVLSSIEELQVDIEGLESGQSSDDNRDLSGPSDSEMPNERPKLAYQPKIEPYNAKVRLPSRSTVSAGSCILRT